MKDTIHNVMNCLKLQFVVTAYDLNPAACTASVSVTVTVNRNPTAPYFSENIYRVRISEYKEVRSRLEPMRNGINTPIYAEDDDPVNSPGGKIFYRFDENFQNEDLLSYFTISKTTGVIFIAKPLTTRENLPDQFNVSHNQFTVKFLNFWMTENFAINNLKFKQRDQSLGYFIKEMQVE